MRTAIVGGIKTVLIVFGVMCLGAVPVLAQGGGMMDHGMTEEEWRQDDMMHWTPWMPGIPGMPGIPWGFQESFATSVIPAADTGGFTFKRGFLLISSEDEGGVFFTIFGVEDSSGNDVDNEENKLVLDLKVNGDDPKSFSFDFDLDNGVGSVSNDLDLDEEDEVEVVQVRIQDPSGNTFGVPGLRIED